ncbi:MAG: type II toxin-antitoxin system VapB family antitoxin [Candidatus Acidiferrum sp.]
MAITIRSSETEKLVRALSRETGESLTDVITNSLRERLERLRRPGTKNLFEDIYDILRRVDALPHLDERTDDEILGYDTQGTPHQ